MARKQNQPSSEAYTAVFPSRLRDLMANTKTTQADLAAALGKTRQAIGYYQDGSSTPSWQALAGIADYFHVSADYLLGRTDVKSFDADLISAVSYTGLSESAVKVLSILHGRGPISLYSAGHAHSVDLSSLLSDLLTNKTFIRFLSSCGTAVDLYKIYNAHKNDVDMVAFDSFSGFYESLIKKVSDETDGLCYLATVRDMAEQYQFRAGKQLQEMIETLSEQKEDA